MKHTLSTSIGVLTLVLAAQGSLLGKLLGNLNVQINACPEIVLNASGDTASSGKPQPQSNNPACPNYVPPGQVHNDSLNFKEQTDLDQSGESSQPEPSLIMVSYAEESTAIADERTNRAPEAPVPQLEASSVVANSIGADMLSMLIAYTQIDQAPGLPMLQPAVTANPASQMSTPSYALSPLSFILPTPTNRDILAEATVITTASRAFESSPTVSTIAEPKKCADYTQPRENTDVIIEGLPQTSSAFIMPMQMPAIPAPLQEDQAWYQAAMPTQQPQQPQPQQPQLEWEWFATQTAAFVPPVSGEFLAKVAETTQTIHIPDGAEGVFFGTRNVGAFPI
ncbi:hypothetical protein COEREDRAFT_87126 [Coemansia reversa NRRL 1564]|uniref:Uncharacterized protein n=1 Tax=Coemansia reversa (strain ATCC 12441 / NRRL 1564) TaxID=763665 RepID=A0A2G5BCI5_COERN|nr:hypothetical protein COEREDRAFT_87126 [Coemansia reversa NRRL 1564]|eukprot:PIA16427.1 hypothetical protein COEREDRAFT_87126 [Coemansia reversa NRRL 1564]